MKKTSFRWARAQATLVGLVALTLIGWGASVSPLFAADSFDDDIPDLDSSLNEELESEPVPSGSGVKQRTTQEIKAGGESEANDALSLEDEPNVDELLADEEPVDSPKETFSNEPSGVLGAQRASGKNLPQRSVADDGTPYQITNLEFKMNKDRSEIVISSTRQPSYQQIQSGKTNQVVFLFENATTGEKLQRAYDTSEFRSPVALFTLFQVPGASQPLSKLIVQMRENVTPELKLSDRGMTLSFPPAADSQDVVIGDKKKDLLAGGNIYGGTQAFSGEAIERLEIKNSEVQDVLRLIARTSGFNIVIGDDVTGTVGTMSLENIPWDQAFTLVLQSKKLGYVREGSVIRVGTTASLKAEKEEAYRIEEASRRVEPLKTLLIPVSYATAAALAPRANGLLSERGKIETDTRTNTIIIKDIESSVSKVQKLISALDTPPPRVQVTARIMEVKNSFQRRLGFFSNSFTGRIGAISFDQASLFGATDGSITNISARDFGNLQLRFAMGELNNEARTIANPSVVVVANQSATVVQKSTLFLPTSTLVPGVGAQQAFTQVPVTLNLQVTPIVAGDGSIFMTVSINNDLTSTAGANFAVDNRSINTQILIENGGTAVIGGVFQNTVNMDRQGIPFLMDLPIVGFLASNKNRTEGRNQVLMFLSARILNAEESFKRTL